MPILQWADITAITQPDAKQTCLNFLSSIGFAATSWQEGSVPLACVELTAEVWSQLSNVAVFLKSMGMNDTSQGDALTQYSSSQYDNTRVLALTAQRTIALSCAAGEGPHTINVGDVVIESADGPTYRNVDDGVTVYPVTIASGGSVTGLVFEAEVAGSAANKAAGTVAGIVTTLAGVTVTSDAILRSGADAEADNRLQIRNKTKWSLLTRFELIAEAVENIVLGAADGITVVAVDASNPRGAGTFDVYVAGDLATAGSSDVGAAQALLDKYVMGSGDGRDRVIAAPEQAVNIAGTVYFRGSFKQADLLAETTAALLDFIQTIPLGGFDFTPGPSQVVPFNDITDVLRDVTVAGQPVKKTVVLTSPAADIAVATFSKVTLGTVTLTFQQAPN